MTAEFSPETKASVDSRSGNVCEICGASRAVEKHHRRPRGMGGTKRADSSSAAACLHVCGGCHRMAESNRNLATLLGWLVPSMFNPATQPVLYRGQWCRLTEDGGIEYEERAA